MFKSLFELPRLGRRFFLLITDSLFIIAALWAGFAIRLGEWWHPILAEAQGLFLLAPAISIPIFLRLGFYRSTLRYPGKDLLYTIVKGVSLSVLILIACWMYLRGAAIPRSAWINYWIVLIALTGGSRLLLRDCLRRIKTSDGQKKLVLIYGAGQAGVQLATLLEHDPKLLPMGFIDDNPELQGSEILGIKVYKSGQLVELIRHYQIEMILLAMPSASHQQRRLILQKLAELPVQMMIMPNLAELASGIKRVDDLRKVEVEDVLGRTCVEPKITLLEASIRDKIVMVTGAGGSIGSELCRQILQLKPQRLLLFELSEFALYSIERELRDSIQRFDYRTELLAMLGSVTHRKRLQQLMESFSVQTVYHAAAYKHVPIVESNPIEGVQNNIIGTLHTAQAAVAAKIETFVLISTDKAVRPTNVMGATKRFAEMILQSLAEESSDTRFCMVRFGNVLESSGSVIPLFREQIRNGGPVTVTHPDVMRYFMTIPEAAQLVIQAGSMAKGGEVFLLDMGEPVKIAELAQHMIELSGYTIRDDEHPDGDIEIQYTGLRPGEKLYEELLINGNTVATAHPMIKCAVEHALPMAALQQHINDLQSASKTFDHSTIRNILLACVEGYKPYDSDQHSKRIAGNDTAA